MDWCVHLYVCTYFLPIHVIYLFTQLQDWLDCCCNNEFALFLSSTTEHVLGVSDMCLLFVFNQKYVVFLAQNKQAGYAMYNL